MKRGLIFNTVWKRNNKIFPSRGRKFSEATVSGHPDFNPLQFHFTYAAAPKYLMKR
jgi:hypothetical protein